MSNSRTYSDEDKGETLRRGFEPNGLAQARNRELAVDEGDDEQIRYNNIPKQIENASHQPEGSDDPKGKSSEAQKTDYGSLNDRDVWGENAGSSR